VIKCKQICLEVRFCDDVRIECVRSKDYEFAITHLRASGLEISSSIAPDLWRACEIAINNLGLELRMQCFVTPSSDANAYVLLGDQNQRIIIGLTSELIRLADTQDLVFVIGHEIGHAIFEHSKTEASGKSEFDELQSLWRSRSCEISADRVGLLACQSLTGAAKVMIKLASGLHLEHLRINPQTFLDQIDTNVHFADYHLRCSHPTLPIRLKSLHTFAKSELYKKSSGAGIVGDSMQDVDSEVQKLLHSLGDGKLHELSEERFTNTLAWLTTSLVFEDHVIDVEEKQMLKTLLGDELAKKMYTFAEWSDRDAVEAKSLEFLKSTMQSSPETMPKLMITLNKFADVLQVQLNETRVGKVLHKLNVGNLNNEIE